MKDEYINEECNPERYHQAVRAEMIARSDEYAEAFAEEWQAEEPYLRLKATQRRKSHDKAAYLAAKERYEKACHKVWQVIDDQQNIYHEAELAAIKQYMARPNLTNPAEFTAWLREHVGLYFIALHDPDCVFMIPRWPQGVWEQYQRRYILFASVHRVFMADGVEAAMTFYKEEEIERKLWNSVWDSSETEKIEGDAAHKNGRFDGGRYETYTPAPLTPIICRPKVAKNSNQRHKTSRLAD